MQLLSLIQSLSEKEKRHFRMYAQLSNKGGKAKFMELFEALTQAATTKATEQILKNKTYSPANKNFLVDKILESLRMQDLHIVKHPVIEVKEITSYLPILLKKRLFKEMRKRLRYAKQKTLKYELFTDHLSIIQWEKKMLWKDNTNNMETLLSFLLEEEATIHAQLKQVLDYQNLKGQIILLRKKDVRLRKAIHQEQFIALINTPLLTQTKVNQLLSTRAKMHYHHLQSIVYKYHYKAPQTAFIHAQQQYQLYNDHQAIRTLNPKAYKESLCLFSEMAYLSNHFKAMQEVIHKIEKLAVQEEQLGIDILNTACFYGLLCAMNTRNYEEGKRVIKVIEKYWDDLAPILKNSRQLAFFYNVFLFYVLFEESETAAPWLEKILHFRRVKERKDIQCIARIWKIIIVYELNGLHLQNAIDSGIKYLKRQANYGLVETCITQAFKKLDKAIEQQAHKQIIQQLQLDLTNLLEIQQKEGNQQLGLQELLFWGALKIAQ